MSEKVLQSDQEQQVASQPDWDSVRATLENFHLPAAPAERAHDVGRMNVSDLIAITTLTHKALVPEGDQNPVDCTMKVKSPDGLRSTTLMDPEDRYSYFEHAAGLINALGKNITPNGAEAFLKRASNVLALATVVAHPFEDGNGRTARTLALLVRSGSGEDVSSDDLATAGSNRPQSGFRINSFVPRMGDTDPRAYLEAVAAVDIPLEQHAAYLEQTEKLFATPFSD